MTDLFCSPKPPSWRLLTRYEILIRRQRGMLKQLWWDIIAWRRTFRSKLKDYNKRFLLLTLKRVLEKRKQHCIQKSAYNETDLLDFGQFGFSQFMGLKFRQLKRSITIYILLMITRQAIKTNCGAGRLHNYLIFRHVLTFNDHLMFLLVGSIWCRSLPRLIELLPEAFLNVNS